MEENVESCYVKSKSGKQILVTKSDGKFYPPLFKGLASYLEDKEIADEMTSNEISRKFVWERIVMTREKHKEFVLMLRENCSPNVCTCGKKELVYIFYVTHILSTNRCVIGSSCIDHWFKSDEEFKKLNQDKYTEELLNFSITKKIIKFDEENISYCKKCFIKNEKKRCPCEIQEDYEKEQQQKLLERNKQIEELRKQNEELCKQNEERDKRIKEMFKQKYTEFKIPFNLKDKAKEYAKNHFIYFKWNNDKKTWYCNKENAHLFEIYEDKGDDKFYFEIDWKECILG